MVQSSSCEANWFAASQEIPRISRNPKVHYRTHKRPPPVSILGQPNPVHIPTSLLQEIHPNITHSSTPRSPQWSPSLRFPHQDPIYPLSSPIPATCPAHLILLDFINRTILGEEYKSFSSSLCNLLHFPLTSSAHFCYILIFGCFPDVRILYTDVSEHTVSETSVYKILTPRKHPKLRIQHSEHFEIFQSRLVYNSMTFQIISALVFRQTDRRWYNYINKIGLCNGGYTKTLKFIDVYCNFYVFFLYMSYCQLIIVARILQLNFHISLLDRQD